MHEDEIFNRAARRVRRHHVAKAPVEDRWLLARMWQELAERAVETQPDAERLLLVGHDFGALDQTPLSGKIVTRCDPGALVDSLMCDEDRMPFASASFDLVLACGTLDSLHDVPGALILIRRFLAKGGRFYGAMLGAGSLVTLRAIVMAGDGPHVARLHPQIDVRAAGDLLARAGFAEPVADMEDVTVRYRQWPRYLADLRANGIGNCLARRHGLPRALLGQWQRRFEAMADGDGRTSEQFCPIYLSARSI